MKLVAKTPFDACKSVAVVEFWNATPHIETSLEICLRASETSLNTYFIHWGAKVEYNECYKKKDNRIPREMKLAELSGPSIQPLYEGLRRCSECHINIDNYLKSSSHLKRLVHKDFPLGALLYANLCDVTKNFQPCIRSHRKILQAMANTFIDVYNTYC